MSNQQSQDRITFFRPLIFGALAGCSAVIITNPIDLAKTRLQLQGELQKQGTYNKQLNGVFDTLYKTFKNEGFLSLYKGLKPALIFQLIMNGFRLGMYDILKNQFYNFTQPNKTHQKFGINLLCSCFTGYVGGFFGSPFNMIKTRLMLQSNFLIQGNRYNYDGFTHAVNQIYNNGGIKLFFQGSTLFGFRTCIASGVQLPAFDLSLEFFQSRLKIYGFNSTLCASVCSTLILTIVMCPIDGLSTRYFNQPFGKDGKGTLYPNAYRGASKIFQIEGLFGFYKGFFALFARLAPHSVLTLIIFSNLKQYFKNY